MFGYLLPLVDLMLARLPGLLACLRYADPAIHRSADPPAPFDSERISFSPYFHLFSPRSLLQDRFHRLASCPSSKPITIISLEECSPTPSFSFPVKSTVNNETFSDQFIIFVQVSNGCFDFFRFVGRAGEPAVARAGIRESSGVELLSDSLSGGGRFSGRPGSLGLEYGDPAQEYPGLAQGRGRQREATGKANQLRERSVAGLYLTLRRTQILRNQRFL